MIALIAITTFILLARAFRSLLLPAKAILLNILSVAAAWGVMVLVWQHGYGSEAIWGIQATGSIPSWMPLMIFAFLFGLSMDYEVFILARMREDYDRDRLDRDGGGRGIGRTGRLVTSAALILFLAFVSMASGPGTDLKMFATGLGAGILLDATVIRALIVPAVIVADGPLELVAPALAGAAAARCPHRRWRGGGRDRGDAGMRLAREAPCGQAVALGLGLLAVVHLAAAGWMLLAADSFVHAIGPVGGTDGHDVGTATVLAAAQGAGLAVALVRPGWRTGSPDDLDRRAGPADRRSVGRDHDRAGRDRRRAHSMPGC